MPYFLDGLLSLGIDAHRFMQVAFGMGILGGFAILHVFA